MFKPSLEVYEDKGLILMIHFQKELMIVKAENAKH